MKKKLYKSSRDKIFTGVVGGIGEYFDVDSTILRLAWALIVVFSGIFPGLIVYILAAIIVPKEPYEYNNQDSVEKKEKSGEVDIDEVNEEYKKIV